MLLNNDRMKSLASNLSFSKISIPRIAMTVESTVLHHHGEKTKSLIHLWPQIVSSVKSSRVRQLYCLQLVSLYLRSRTLLWTLESGKRCSDRSLTHVLPLINRSPFPTTRP